MSAWSFLEDPREVAFRTEIARLSSPFGTILARAAHSGKTELVIFFVAEVGGRAVCGRQTGFRVGYAERLLQV
jgi:hypothetical protein